MSYRGGSEQILIIFVPCGIYLLHYVFVLQRWYAGCWAMNMEWPSAAHHMVTTHPPCLLCDPNVTAQRNRLPNVTWWKMIPHVTDKSMLQWLVTLGRGLELVS